MEHMDQLRPVGHLHRMMKLYPDTPKQVNGFLADRDTEVLDWPDWCFLPMGAWYAIVSAGNGVDRLPLHLSADVARLAAIGSWRYSQSIYRLDPDLMAALVDTPVSGSIPSDVLFRLPEWCVYVETPGWTWEGEALYGFWVHLESDDNSGRAELRFLLDCESILIGLPLHIGPWTIIEAVDRMASEAKNNLQKISVSETFSSHAETALGPDAIQAIGEQINPLVSLVLYLCSEEPELDGLKKPSAPLTRPALKKTKQGWKLFPPEKITIRTVGVAIGEQLRNAGTGDPTGKTVRTHLRRGHWHGYWTGPRTGERKFVYHWISPLVVRGSQDREENS